MSPLSTEGVAKPKKTPGSSTAKHKALVDSAHESLCEKAVKAFGQKRQSIPARALNQEIASQASDIQEKILTDITQPVEAENPQRFPVNPLTPAPLPRPGTNASQCAPQVSPNRSKPQWMTPSANPMPFKPSMERQWALPPRLTPVNPTQHGHPGCLIVEFKPKLPVEKQVQGWFLREKINLSVEMEEAPENICVAGISWSHTGNPIVIAADGCSAVDLMTYEDTIVNALIGNTEGEFLTDAHPDVEYHKVKLNGVPTQSFSLSGEPYDAEDVMEEFAEQCVAYRLMGQYAKPIWLGSAGTENRKTMGMVVFSFANAEDARTLLNIRRVFIFGEACTITRYEDRAPIWYCKKCGSIGHSTATCRNGDRCKTCSAPTADHDTHNHPVGVPAKCIDCHRDHASTDKNFPMRKHKEGRATPGAPKTPGGGPIPGKGKETAKMKGKGPMRPPADQAMQKSTGMPAVPTNTATQRPAFKAGKWKTMCKKTAKGPVELSQQEAEDMVEDNSTVNEPPPPQSQ
ncbi:hypothetical protein BS47DRAFT_1422373 [Hydnum rufescens UP504]|uniref:CCHC-type domain-containing protein n=1 Tax=Hydnum rufescens UP504 TaxID=1448309 RepID=A0A9P6AK57_9AGAM|nr:hypothetical protein BS47DRAFT_1422373 [Hydnum rufescens UP504]